MPRIDLYVNVQSKFDIVRKLASKVLERRIYALIYTLDDKLANQIDEYLWSTPALSFMPHARSVHGLDARYPVIIGDASTSTLRFDLLINMDEELPSWFNSFERTIEIYENNLTDINQARNKYKSLRKLGHSLVVHDLRGI